MNRYKEKAGNKLPVCCHTTEFPASLSNYQLSLLHDAREAHECHCQQTCGNQSNRSPLHSFRNLHQGHLLTQSGKQYQCQTKAKSSRECVYNTCQQIKVFLDYQDCHTENTAVRCNQRQEHPSA